MIWALKFIIPQVVPQLYLSYIVFHNFIDVCKGIKPLGKSPLHLYTGGSFQRDVDNNGA